MTTDNYILGFGVSDEHFRQFVAPLPYGDSDKKEPDMNGNKKYEGYFMENLYSISTPSSLYRFMEAVFEIDYAYSLRRQYRQENNIPEYEYCCELEDKYVEEKFRDYKQRRFIPEVFKHLTIGFVIRYESDTIISFVIGLEIKNLSDYAEKAIEFEKYCDSIREFFDLEDEYTCPSIYKVN
jgi:hypothetical protein